MERTKGHHPAKLAVAEDLCLIGLAFLGFASCGGVMAHLAGLSVERRIEACGTRYIATWWHHELSTIHPS
jgi:hypothetical protein